MNKKYSPIMRVFTLYVLINFVATIFFPSMASALTSGPSSPEFSKFTPVSATDMVNLFTGDFSYNLPVIEIPGPHSSGYALSLSYNCGNSMESEASWVGFGWTLNPGSINRSVRGFPDDYNGKDIDYYNKTRATWTATGSQTAGLEVFSMSSDRLINQFVGLSLGKINRINNYTGYQKSTNVGLSVFNGSAGINANFSQDGSITYSAYLSPLSLVSNKIIEAFNIHGDYIGVLECELENEDYDQNYKQKLSNQKRAHEKTGNFVAGSLSSLYTMRSQASPPKPFLFAKTKGFSATWSTTLGIRAAGPVPIGVERGDLGSFNLKYNQAHKQVKAYGYLHSSESGGEGSVSDYFVEKNRPFSPQHVFIGIPFSNYDVYNVSGEGIGGGFRSYLDKVGSFAPSEIKSNTKALELGFEVAIGSNVGLGLTLGLGYQQTKVGEWSYSGTKPVFGDQNFYRFNNDLGGQVAYPHVSTDTEQAKVRVTSPVPGFMGAKASVQEYYDITKDQPGAIPASYFGSSSYIKQTTINNKEAFKIYKKNGQLYVYGYPVKVRNETEIAVDIDAQKHRIENRYLAFRDLKLGKNGDAYSFDTDGYRTTIGSVNPNDYTSNYLLTEILSSDYADVNNNQKADQEDFGGWTKFNYQSAYGANGEWYRYRMPYNGLVYKQNSISDTKDDTGVLSTGEKEVHYLESIETKTHVAYFITNKTTGNDCEWLNGSGRTRFDGVGAKDPDTNTDPAAKEGGSGDRTLEYLEKIVLFSKDKNGVEDQSKPLKVVHFEYDYNLVPNVANNVNSSYNYYDTSGGGHQSGKLTLRKVWMEYEGVVNAKISPYVFNYKYPSQFGASQKLETIFQSYSHLSDGEQNPAYEPYALDPWGNIMPGGKERKTEGVSWIDQSKYIDYLPAEGEAVSEQYASNKKFDPGAYQLKSIVLPSGGTIHVQYEAKDYAYVQNRNAMAMARIVSPEMLKEAGSLELETAVQNGNAFIVKVEDLGVKPDQEEDVEELVSKINSHFEQIATEDGQQRRKIYFKFLYGLTSNSIPDLDNCRSEYISGYANFVNASRVNLTDGTQAIAIEVAEEDGSSGSKGIGPWQACYDFVMNQRVGKLDGPDCIEPLFERTYDNRIQEAVESSGDLDLTGLTMEILGRLVLGINPGTYGSYDKSTVCTSIKEESSFFKLPILNSKIGGGVRVKRLLLHDAGIETGDEVLMGTHYRYVLEDGVTSSGVATNEPGSAREENPLVDFMSQKAQSWYDKLTVGENKEQTEGPIGESLLPPASIGYSRVITEAIHTGKTGTGFSIHEFYTTKDYYFDKAYNHVKGDRYDFTGNGAENSSLSSVDDQLKLPLVVVNYNIDRSWKTQGFRFIQTNMNGQVKQTTSWNGAYGKNAEGVEDISNCRIVSSQVYDYYEPGEKVPILSLDESGQLQQRLSMPGKEMDIAMESKRIKDVVLDLSIEFDVSVGMSFPPPIFIGLFPAFSYTENLIATHATTKVISYPTIVKKVTNYANGITSTSENVVFDESTGTPLLVKTNDSSDKGSYYSFSLPAHWFYTGMGSKAQRESNTNQLNSQSVHFSVYNREPDQSWLSSGLPNLLSASIQTYTKRWWSDNMRLNSKLSSRYELNEAGYHYSQLDAVYRPEASFLFHSELDNQDEGIYNKGFYSYGATFDFNNLEGNTNYQTGGKYWIPANRITSYSPNGEVLEEIDAMDIPSTALYGPQYGNSVPVMVATNADYGSVLFNDYEGEKSSLLTSDFAHSGKQCLIYTPGTVLISDGVVNNSAISETGALLKCWVKADTHLPLYVRTSGSTEYPEDLRLTKLARVGEWILYEVVIDKKYIPSSTPFTASLVVNTEVTDSGDGSVDVASETIYVDDLRFQPLEASANCFVYDAQSLRLIAQFDDQHFGTYYQYNAEGKLVRKIVETERGMRTLQENGYHLPSVSRKGEITGSGLQ